jgi:large subunit ribosomal protein L29
MKANELRERKVDELESELKRAREALSKARFARASSQLKNHAEIRSRKREIARILTILREKGKK